MLLSLLQLLLHREKPSPVHPNNNPSRSKPELLKCPKSITPQPFHSRFYKGSFRHSFRASFAGSIQGLSLGFKIHAGFKGIRVQGLKVVDLRLGVKRRRPILSSIEMVKNRESQT